MPRTAVARAAVVKKPQQHDPQQHDPQQPVASAPPLPQQLEEPAICRLCWGEAEEGDQLLSPCNCSGSLKYIHEHCLADWQQTLRSQGQGRRAHICELCKTPYRLQQGGSRQQRPGGRQLRRRLVAAVSGGLFDAVYRTPWPSLAVQAWHSYVMTYGALQAVKTGLSGFGAGLSLGKILIEEQACLLNGLLSYTSNLLGSPYAEVLWCQAVGALFVGMLSELVYTSILGMLGGIAYGFCMGYVGAIKGSVQLVSGVSCKLLSGVALVAARAFRRVLRIVRRV